MVFYFIIFNNLSKLKNIYKYEQIYQRPFWGQIVALVMFELILFNKNSWMFVPKL